MATKTKVRAGVIVVALLTVAALLPIVGRSRESEREVRLVAVDNTFYLVGQRTPNPTLKLRAGELVRLILRNEDDGMRHDLRIRDWNVVVPAIQGKGERDVTFRVPDVRGVASYACTPHSSSMQGSIEIE
jgi:hypothetical protein